MFWHVYFWAGKVHCASKLLEEATDEEWDIREQVYEQATLDRARFTLPRDRRRTGRNFRR